MDQPALTVLLAPILGSHTTAVVSWIIVLAFVASQVLPYLPVAASASSPWYRVAYGLVARLGGSRGNAAPMPPVGQVPAGGLVPTPPALKQAAAPAPDTSQETHHA